MEFGRGVRDENSTSAGQLLATGETGKEGNWGSYSC